jgi:2-polyprenyl-6-hydroxyphenyl methylase / 3-demethylubiquinone-9 3-methyltransferase
VTFEGNLYGPGYFEGLHKSHWFTNPPRKYEERNRDTLRVVDARTSDRVLEIGSARGDVTFFLARHVREVVGLDASDDALRIAEAARAARGASNVSFVKGDAADLSQFGDGSFDAIAAIDLVEHVDDATLAAMLGESRRVLKRGGRLGLYTPDRAHYVERLKAHDLVLRQFPQHIAVRRAAAYRGFLRDAGFSIDLDTWSVSPFPFVRLVERALAPLPLIGETFRYRILMRARTP